MRRLFSCLNKSLRSTSKCSYSIGNKEFVEKMELPSTALPSEEFLTALGRNYQDKMARIITEIEFLYSISREVPKTITDAHWKELFYMNNSMNREHYLRSIYNAEQNRERNEQENLQKNEFLIKEREIKIKRMEAGEMVYGTMFNDLYGCFRGSEFRKMLDRLYGSRIWRAHRLDEPLIKLVIDCRNLHSAATHNIYSSIGSIQVLYDTNWISPYPFEIIIANFHADDAMSRAIKKRWRFLFGPQEKSPTDTFSEFPEADSASIERSDDENDCKNTPKFTPALFIPKITTQGIRESIGMGIQSDEMVYVAPKSIKFLDEHQNPEKIKVFVVSAFDSPTNPWHKSITCALKDDIPAYRLPFEKFVIQSEINQYIPLCNISRILNDVYLAKSPWKLAIQKNFPTFHKKLNPTNREEILEERNKRLYLLRKLEEKMNERRVEISPKLNFTGKRIYKHAYTREERNGRKEYEAILKEKKLAN